MSGVLHTEDYHKKWLEALSTTNENALLGINVHDPNSATIGDIPLCAYTGGYIFPKITNIVMTGMDCVTACDNESVPTGRKRPRNSRNKKIDLLQIAQCTPGADLNPHRFAAARMTLRANLCGHEERDLCTVDFSEKSKCESFLHYIMESGTFDRACAKRKGAPTSLLDKASRATGLYFDTGKYVVTGTASEFQALMAIQLIVASYSREDFENGLPKPNFLKKPTWPKCNVENVVAAMQLFPPPHDRINLRKISTRLGSECTYEPDLFPGVIYRPMDGGNKLRCFLLFESSQAVLAGSRNEKEVFIEFKKFVKKIYKLNL
jgi:TATA-box binding protein (TBP) (component of TFIID and TFIIIB)